MTNTLQTITPTNLSDRWDSTAQVFRGDAGGLAVENLFDDPGRGAPVICWLLALLISATFRRWMPSYCKFVKLSLRSAW
jgi:hypothetical protein